MSDKLDINNQPELLDSIIGLIDQTRHFCCQNS